MKTLLAGICFTAALSFSAIGVAAQDSSKTSAIQQISAGSENADNIHGRKIQQQSIANHQFGKLDSMAVKKPASRKTGKKKNKPQNITSLKRDPLPAF